MTNKKVLVLCEDLYEEMELWYPYYRLLEEGFEVLLVGTAKLEYKGKNGLPVKADILVEELDPAAVDAVVIPGGYAPDKLRRYEKVLDLVRSLHERGRVVATICHGPWVLISAGILRDKNVTSYYAIKDDVVNAGGIYQDSPVVVDDNIISSRKPEDLPNFLKAIIKNIREK